MCIVSVVSEYAGRWAQPPYPNPLDSGHYRITLAQKMDPGALDLLKHILALCEKLDAKMGEPDCVDPNKAKIIAALEEYVASQKDAV